MNLEQAISNISQVLYQGRIEMPNGSLTSQEHQQLAADLSLLISHAQLADKQEIDIASLKGKLNDAEAKIRELELVGVDTPEVPDEKIVGPGSREYKRGK